jgi:hypothetical protein
LISRNPAPDFRIICEITILAKKSKISFLDFKIFRAKSQKKSPRSFKFSNTPRGPEGLKARETGLPARRKMAIRDRQAIVKKLSEEPRGSPKAPFPYRKPLNSPPWLRQPIGLKITKYLIPLKL